LGEPWGSSCLVLNSFPFSPQAMTTRMTTTTTITQETTTAVIRTISLRGGNLGEEEEHGVAHYLQELRYLVAYIWDAWWSLFFASRVLQPLPGE
jgi:hypothetical protein